MSQDGSLLKVKKCYGENKISDASAVVSPFYLDTYLRTFVQRHVPTYLEKHNIFDGGRFQYTFFTILGEFLMITPREIMY